MKYRIIVPRSIWIRFAVWNYGVDWTYQILKGKRSQNRYTIRDGCVEIKADTLCPITSKRQAQWIMNRIAAIAAWQTGRMGKPAISPLADMRVEKF